MINTQIINGLNFAPLFCLIGRNSGQTFAESAILTGTCIYARLEQIDLLRQTHPSLKNIYVWNELFADLLTDKDVSLRFLNLNTRTMLFS